MASLRTIRKVLIANRGEIACRIERTCNAMGIVAVAVCSDAELDAKHVLGATEAVRLGPPPVSESYLRGNLIVDLAKRLGVDAIHPGYGFLSENAEFAASVAKADMESIGPPCSAIEAMGSKSQSKVLMEAAGVPVVPGYHGDEQDAAFLEQKATEIGFPLLIKAVAGGGGKGMKIVRSREEFSDQLQSAQREAVNFFKDSRVILERYIERPRHIECQVFFDKFGNGVFFFERDCSVQRRYQKVLEEAPAPKLSAEVRAHIGDIAVRAAKAVGYVGAGTVEFIFDTDSEKFYFMEMNTRLQVEHPVTEEVSRIRGVPLDLVRLQIDIAAGHPLGFTQDDVTCEGSCIEARIFAEDPQRDFLPQSGPLVAVQEPRVGTYQGVRVRIDTGFRQGDDISVYYDPMIAKLIVWGPNRAEALRGLRNALREFNIAGIKTNVDFLLRCCENAAYQEGGVTTAFIAENKAELLQEPPLDTRNVALAAASVYDKWSATNGTPGQAFRLNVPTSSFDFPVAGPDGSSIVYRFSYDCQTRQHTLYAPDGKALHTVEWLPRTLKPSHLAALVDGYFRVDWQPTLLPDAVVLFVNTGTVRVPVPSVSAKFGSPDDVVGAASDTFVSPMSGKVTKLAVAEGASVARGAVLVVLEAMKMEHLVRAPKDGVVRFDVAVGAVTTADAVLGRIDAPKEA